MDIRRDDIVAGQTYPICGMITDVIADSTDTMTVVVEDYYRMKLTLRDGDSKELIKGRAFETAIFISTFTSRYEADCQTVIFGKKPQRTLN